MDKIKDVDWRGLVKTATQKVKKYTMNLTDLEIKVEEATSAETWGPHGSTMNEIADAAFDPENYRQIMGVLARRLQEKDENWRMAYKALLLLEHLIKHGPGKIVGDVQSSAGVLDRLCHFQYKDANMKDHGVNVRHRAKEILQLVNSPERLREEREKAKANRQKYRGVSADQMRSSGGTGSSSFGRSGSDRYTSASIGSLHGASSGGGLGGSSGGGGLGGLGGGGGGGYVASRRTDSYDETEHDSHYISKRATPAGASEAAAPAGASSSSEDALAATRARIERLKLEEKEKAAGEGAAAESSKKKLTDVKVNPKIAASLGLKIPAAPAAGVAPAPAAATGAAGIDLLGGLDNPSPAPAPPVAPTAAPAAAPAASPAAASFDPFAAPAAAPPASQPPQQQAWDAFASAGGSSRTAPAAPAASPFDLLGGLGSGSTPYTAVQQQPPAAAAAATPADPFAAFTAPVLPAPASQPPAMAAAAAPRPAAAAAPAARLASVAAGVPAALPEDMFSDLTGIGRPQQPMGHVPHAPQAASSGGLGWGLPQAAAPQPAGLLPPSPGNNGFGAFGSAAGGPVGGAVGGFAPAPPAGGLVIGMGVPVVSHTQQPSPPPGHARSGSMGGHSADFGSFSYSAAPAQGSATAADPFADLLK